MCGSFATRGIPLAGSSEARAGPTTEARSHCRGRASLLGCWHEPEGVLRRRRAGRGGRAGRVLAKTSERRADDRPERVADTSGRAGDVATDAGRVERCIRWGRHHGPGRKSCPVDRLRASPDRSNDASQRNLTVDRRRPMSRNVAPALRQLLPFAAAQRDRPWLRRSLRRGSHPLPRRGVEPSPAIRGLVRGVPLPPESARRRCRAFPERVAPETSTSSLDRLLRLARTRSRALDRSLSMAAVVVPRCRAISRLEKPARFQAHTSRSSGESILSTCRNRTRRSISAGLPSLEGMDRIASSPSSEARVRRLRAAGPRLSLDTATERRTTHAYA
jgi:hypothetical protein